MKACSRWSAIRPTSSSSRNRAPKPAFARTLDAVIREAERRVLVTTFASNAARLQTLGHVAQDTGRRLCVAGRCSTASSRVAKSVGYLADFPETVDFDDRDAAAAPRGDDPRHRRAGRAARGAGADRRSTASAQPRQGRPRPLLVQADSGQRTRDRPHPEPARRARESRWSPTARRQSTSPAIPGRPELAAMYDWIRPEIIVPVHGEMRHMMEQARFAQFAAECPTVSSRRTAISFRLAPDGPEKIARGAGRPPGPRRRRYPAGRRRDDERTPPACA